jgi:transketolase
MHINDTEELELKKTALELRKNVLRMIKAGGSGHVGGALSMTEVVTVLKFKLMKIDPKNPTMKNRDRLVLSAGHKALILYAVLAERGYFDKKVLDTYGDLDSKLPGHPSMDKLPGVEANTGALGHGLSLAGGMAMGLKMDKTDAKVYAIMGDGELAEGSNWEAAAAASNHKLDNLIVFVDRNGLQISGPTTEVMNYEPLADRWQSFGWSVKTIDGHDLKEIVSVASSAPFETGKPSLIIANTVKAKGLSFAEGKANFHYWTATKEEFEQAEKDLEKIGAGLEAGGK